MSWFRTRSFGADIPKRSHPAVPLTHLDVSKRYDAYCIVAGEERVYENVSFVGIRTLEGIHEFLSPTSAYLEIEAIDGTRMLIPSFGIQLLCEHGAEPVYRVLRRRGDGWEY